MTSNIIVNRDNPEIFRYASANELPRVGEISVNRLPDTDPEYFKVVDNDVVEMTDIEKQSLDTSVLFTELRQKRNILLKNTDWIIIKQYEDNMLSISRYRPWLEYRQSLRDLPANTVDPTNIVWPIEPT